MSKFLQNAKNLQILPNEMKTVKTEHLKRQDPLLKTKNLESVSCKRPQKSILSISSLRRNNYKTNFVLEKKRDLRLTLQTLFGNLTRSFESQKMFFLHVRLTPAETVSFSTFFQNAISSLDSESDSSSLFSTNLASPAFDSDFGMSPEFGQRVVLVLTPLVQATLHLFSENNVDFFHFATGAFGLSILFVCSLEICPSKLDSLQKKFAYLCISKFPNNFQPKLSHFQNYFDFAAFSRRRFFSTFETVPHMVLYNRSPSDFARLVRSTKPPTPAEAIGKRDFDTMSQLKSDSKENRTNLCNESPEEPSLSPNFRKCSFVLDTHSSQKKESRSVDFGAEMDQFVRVNADALGRFKKNPFSVIMHPLVSRSDLEKFLRRKDTIKKFLVLRNYSFSDLLVNRDLELPLACLMGKINEREKRCLENIQSVSDKTSPDRENVSLVLDSLDRDWQDLVHSL